MTDEKNTTGDREAFLMSYEDSCDRVPVLWIHGYPLSNLLWDFQIDGLADVCRLLTPDLRGHGGSEATEPPYSVGTFADDCADLLDHLGVTGPVVVAGLSMGGYIAFEFYRRYPERVAGMILAATRAGADSDEGKINRDKAAGVAIAEGVEVVVDGMLPKLLAPDNLVEQEDMVEFVREMMLATAEDGMVGALTAMRDRPDSTPLLAKIDVPVLIVHGEEDQLIPVSEAQSMQDAIPGSELVIVPAAGHLPNLEQPEVFNDAVRGYLEQFYEE